MVNDIVTNLELYGDLPPYDRDHYVGTDANHMQQVARLVTSTGVNRVSKSTGFCAPLGLLCIDPFGCETAYRVVINLVPGTYHGVYAREGDLNGPGRYKFPNRP